MEEIKVTTFSDETTTLYKATMSDTPETLPVVTLFNSWDHNGGQFPGEDLDTMISILTELRDKIAHTKALEGMTNEEKIAEFERMNEAD